MLKSKQNKVILGTIGILIVFVAASIWASLSFKSNSAGRFQYDSLADASSNTSSATQIDHIIENSNDATLGDKSVYNICVIAPTEGDKATAQARLDSFFIDGGFQNYIVNDYRTIEEAMADGKVAAAYYSANAMKSMEATEIAEILSKADLLYVTASSATAYTGGNAISENLYEAIHAYAFGSGKPMIMDYELDNSGSENDDNGGGATVATSKTFEFYKDSTNSWKRAKTYIVSDWTTATDIAPIETFMTDLRSIYGFYELNNNTLPTGYANWQAYWQRTSDPATPVSQMNVLYINPTSATATDLNAFAGNTTASWMLSTGATGVFGSSRFSPTTNYPANVTVTPMLASALTEADLYAADGVTKKYDYIFIAPGDYATCDLSEDAITALKSVANSKDGGLTYLMFGAVTGPASSSTPSGSGVITAGNYTIDTTNSYGKLIDMSMTTAGYMKKSNILVVGTSYMGTLAANPALNTKKAYQIVTLINKSTYRTYAGSGNGGNSGSISTSAYRVLELEPCYPIDLELAVSLNSGKTTSGLSQYTCVSELGGWQNKASTPQGNYYTIPANVLNTSEIDMYMTESGGTYSMNQEYYDWDLSKAKLAYALGKSAENIELVQMSSEEYITAKADVSDAYDLIYIGGNMSALKSHYAYGFDMDSHTARPNQLDAYAYFSMYAHTGETFGLRGYNRSYTYKDDYSFMNGNDITYDRYLQLKDYIDSGLPMVFSNEIWTAYLDAKANGYSNRYIDPDSNMYKLCAYAETKQAEAGNTSILLNWATKVKTHAANDYLYTDYWNDVATKTVDNSTGLYGTTAKVQVFASDALNDDLYSCVYGTNTSLRPKYSLSTTAIAYVEGDESTEIKDRNLTWDLTLAEGTPNPENYEAMLFEDANDNGVFSAGEAITAAKAFGADGKVQLTYSYPAKDFGAFNWKVVVRTKGTTNVKASTSVISCIAIDDNQDKMEASILEIMPMMASNCNSSNPTAPDGHTFYLDKNYQQSSGNPYLFSTWGTAKNAEYGYCPSQQTSGKGDDGVSTSDEMSFNSNLVAGAYKNGGFNNGSGACMGKYKSELSINRYDSAAGREDRDYNYMDLVSDKYDFNLDIMYMDDVIYYADAVRNTSEAERETYLQKAETAYATYLAYETPGTAEYDELNLVETKLRDTLVEIRDANGSGTYAPGNITVNVSGAPYTLNPTCNMSEFKTYGITQMLQSRDYFRFFYLNNSLYYGTNWCQPAAMVFWAAYRPYTDVHDKMIDAYREYRHYSMLAYGPDEYLRRNYDVIVVGFMDSYHRKIADFSQNAADDLMTFTQNTTLKDAEGNDLPAGGLLMTHDNLTADTGKGATKILTDTVRDYTGLDGSLKLSAVAGTETSRYSKYESTDSDRYFLSNISTTMDFSKNSTLSAGDWNSSVNTWATQAGYSSPKKIVPAGYTDIYNIFQTAGFNYAVRYTYGELEMENAVTSNDQITGPLNVSGSSKATQVNRGVVTTYPFYIASELRVSNTHGQYFALDMENEDVAVWYTLAGDNQSTAGQAGGTNYTLMKNNSALFAASPKDGMDSYYIYSVGNIVYCGAGHALITGYQRDNNDERRLFLNVLINMAKKSKPKAKDVTDIILYDPDGVTKAPGNVVKKSSTDGYYIEVNSGVTYPEFGFQIKKNAGETVTDIQVFYDLDYTDTQDATIANMCPTTGTLADKHFLIQLPSDILTTLNTGSVFVLTKEQCPGLITKREYFDAYGGNYTYIVIRMTYKDSAGATKVVTKRIKVMLTREMLDLT